MSLVLRSYDRTENDDFKLNVEDRLSGSTEAIPIHIIRYDTDWVPSNPILIGWKIQQRGE